MKKLFLLMMVLFVGGLAGCSEKDDGMLKISSDPGDAEVYIDGERKGNTPAKKGQTYAIKLSEGEHTIEVIKPIENPGKYDQYYATRKVFLAEKTLQTVSLELEKRQTKLHKEKWDEEQRQKEFARAEKARLKDEEDKRRISYAIGLDIGLSFKDLDIAVNLEAILKAVRDTLAGSTTMITKEEAENIKAEVFRKMKVAEDAGKKLLGSQSEREVKLFSYALGMDTASALQKVKYDLDIDVFSKAFEDVLTGSDKMISFEEANLIKKDFFSKRSIEVQEDRRNAATRNKESSAAFLAKNAKKGGVIVTASGLQYEVISRGIGRKPTEKDTVKVHYRGTLLNGTEFDSSYKRDQPISFPVSGVIKGWTEGLQLMAVGSKYKFCIPPALAYGDRGLGARIEPNATLIFEIELLSIEK